MSKEIDLRAKLSRSTATQKTIPTKSAPRQSSPTPVVDEDELVRKEFRIRPDQGADLARLRRRINAARTAAEKPLDVSQKSPSMTDRILARVALDYLLEHADSLTGWTEQELLDSLRNAKD